MINEKIRKIEKYNFWYDKPNNLGLIRKEYLNKLIETSGNKDLIKVIIGQRRVGKSYIFKQFISYLMDNKQINSKNIIYINMEYEDFSFIKDKDDLKELIKLYFQEIKPKGKIFLFVDEIQEILGWEKIINSIRADHTQNIEIFITGSNSKLLSGELSTYLSGRYICFNIYPFSYKEYLKIKNTKNTKQSFLSYLNFSGLPELFNLPNQELQRNYIRGLKDTIILRDLVKRYKIKEVDLLEKVFLFLLNNISNLFSINSIHRKLKSQGINISSTTISNYLRYFQDVFVFYGVDRFDLKGKKILEGEKKYYLNDLGFINFLFSSFEGYIGKKLENYVFNYLKKNNYEVYIGTLGKKEIDFIAEKNNKKIYIQVAYILGNQDVIDREFGNLRKIKDSFPKYVISMDDILLPTDKYGIQHIQVWNLDL